MAALVVTADEVAKAAQVRPPRMASIVSGAVTPDVNEAARLAYSLGVSIGELTTAGPR